MNAAVWVYELASGRFLRGGCVVPQYDPGTEGLAEYPIDNQPDPGTERYDVAATHRRPATAQELEAAATAEADATTDAQAALKIVRATVVWTLRRLLGRNPTGPEVTTAMTEWKAVYRALNGA